METSLLIQYILIIAIVLFAGITFYRMLAKIFSAGKFKKGKPGCDSDCGCS